MPWHQRTVSSVGYLDDDESMARKVVSKPKPFKLRRSASARAPTVVLVDDDFQVRRAFERLLREHGLKVTSFERPSEVLVSRLPATEVVLIADIYMPEMTGVALCQQLQARGLNIPTILITGHLDEHAILYGTQIQAVSVLFKPIEEKDLLEAIGQALRVIY